jgi:hypothetical protein
MYSLNTRYKPNKDKVKVSLTGFVFKKEAFCIFSFDVAVNHEEK